MHLPLIVIENGDISIFESAEAAVRYLEPIDVTNQEYTAYDGAARKLRLLPTVPVVTIAGAESESCCRSELEGSLRSFVERASGQPVPANIRTLEDILTFCIRKYGYTR